MSKVIKHTHRLKRHTYKTTGNSIFHCILPDCHFKIEVPLALGKKSVCNRCGNDFIINEISIRQAKPHCDACTNRRGSKNERLHAITKVMAKDSIDSLRSRLDEPVSVANENGYNSVKPEDDIL